MNYSITFDRSTKDEPVLVVTRPGGWFGAPETLVVKVIQGEEAVELWNRLTKKDVEVRVEKQN